MAIFSFNHLTQNTVSLKKKKTLLLVTTGVRPAECSEIFKRPFCHKMSLHWCTSFSPGAGTA